MKPRAAALVLVFAAVATIARSGHELPVYPSYYPHEIEIQRMTPERAAALLADGKLHAYVGGAPQFSGAPPESVRAIESLGSFVVLRANPATPLGKDSEAACALVQSVLRDIAGRGDGFIFHPYPVTPFHGDYLHHADRAEAAKARVIANAEKAPAAPPKIRTTGELASRLIRPEWRADGLEWDVAIETVSADGLAASSMQSTNGWLAPRWIKAGWFHAYRVLAGSEPAADVQADFERIHAMDQDSAVERINRERDLVAKLTAGCRATVAGYTVKREFIGVEFSAGVENVAFDSIAGLSSPMFLRTVKLKDFPWNGWLALGIGAAPDAAWNPIAGFTDPFGRLAWYAVGDPAAIPSPYDSAWVLNRISGVEAPPRR